jgi:hypothetical protein
MAGSHSLLAEDIMSAWETSLEALDSTLRRKFDDDEEFEDDGFTFDDDEDEDEDLEDDEDLDEDEDDFDDEDLEEFEDFDEDEEKE